MSKPVMYLKFTRKCNIVEVGSVAIEVDKGDTWEDLIEKAYDEEFAEFLVTDRVYVDTDWKFSEFDEDEDSDYNEEFDIMENAVSSFFELANDKAFVDKWLEKKRRNKKDEDNDEES